MPGLFGDEVEDHEAQVTVREEPAETRAAATAVRFVVEAWLSQGPTEAACAAGKAAFMVVMRVMR